MLCVHHCTQPQYAQCDFRFTYTAPGRVCIIAALSVVAAKAAREVGQARAHVAAHLLGHCLIGQ